MQKIWAEISRQYRSSIGYCCENCGVNLSTYPHLLDVHHKMVLNEIIDLRIFRALCRLCHSKEDHHNHMKIDEYDSGLIERLRHRTI